jgi:hypothetical protein
LERQLRAAAESDREYAATQAVSEEEDCSMNPDGQLKRVAMVQFERILPGPIERVWSFLTDTKQLPGWFGEGTNAARYGLDLSNLAR